jgi:hypothetical protein
MRERKAWRIVDDSGTSQVNGDAVGVGAETGPVILGSPSAGGGGTAPKPEMGLVVNAGGGQGEFDRDDEAGETDEVVGARVEVMILRRDAKPPKLLRFA